MPAHVPSSPRTRCISTAAWPYERTVFVAPHTRTWNARTVTLSAVDVDELRCLVRSAVGDDDRVTVSAIPDHFGHTAMVSALGGTQTEAVVVAETIVEVVAARTAWKPKLDTEIDRIADREDRRPARTINDVIDEVMARIERIDPTVFHRTDDSRRPEDVSSWETLMDCGAILTKLGIRLPSDLREEIHYYCIDHAWRPRIEHAARYQLRDLP